MDQVFNICAAKDDGELYYVAERFKEKSRVITIDDDYEYFAPNKDIRKATPRECARYWYESYQILLRKMNKEWY